MLRSSLAAILCKVFTPSFRTIRDGAPSTRETQELAPAPAPGG
jgi:hypothetical protein